MDKLLSREVIMIVICSITITALMWEIVQCIIVGFGGIPEEEAEDEKIKRH